MKRNAMHTRKWKELGAVADGIRHKAAMTRAHALDLPLMSKVAIARPLRRLRFRMLYASMVQVRYAERLVRTQSRQEAYYIMERVTPLLRPPLMHFVVLLSVSNT